MHWKLNDLAQRPLFRATQIILLLTDQIIFLEVAYQRAQ